ncbi:hypothetical protein B0H14DRAFT_2911782, partial [Mycena olivaceomarginata]
MPLVASALAATSSAPSHSKPASATQQKTRRAASASSAASAAPVIHSPSHTLFLSPPARDDHLWDLPHSLSPHDACSSRAALLAGAAHPPARAAPTPVPYCPCRTHRCRHTATVFSPDSALTSQRLRLSTSPARNTTRSLSVVCSICRTGCQSPASPSSPHRMLAPRFRLSGTTDPMRITSGVRTTCDNPSHPQRP